MLKKSFPLAAGLAAFASVAVMTGCASDSKPDYTNMPADELAEHLIFETDSFRMDQEVQEGGRAEQRLVQDELQEACTVVGGGQPDSDTMAEVAKMARETIEYPEGGIELGDWEKGAELAWSGFGYRIGHKVDNHDQRETGGLCVNCHSFQEERIEGTIGPDLTGYGNDRGASEDMIKFAYDQMYNPHATFACTDMPRFGAKDLLNKDQIQHLLAYLFDPESPVNQ
ncbi:MAG: sulfur oxidation c-type cytochrome SoxX [Pseudomonadota bacterium]